MISATASRPHFSTALPAGVEIPAPQRPGATQDVPHQLSHPGVVHAPPSQKTVGKRDSNPLPFAAPHFWNGAQPPQKMSAERLSSVISALEIASQRLALSGTHGHVSKSGAPQAAYPHTTVARPVTTSFSISATPAEASANELALGAEKKAAFVAKFAPAELHGLLILLLQIQNNLARTQADVMQVALRQIMAATHARANSIRLDAAIAFGVSIGAAALSIGLNVAGTRKSLQGLARRDATTRKFDGAEKTWQKAEKAAIRQPGDTPDATAVKAHSLADAKETYTGAKMERDLAFTTAERMQLKGNAMVQGARIAESFIFAFSALSSGLQRAAQVDMETSKTMAELWRGQVQTEADQRRQALQAALDSMKSLHSLELQGWNNVRIA